jgi:hypothetical protein
MPSISLGSWKKGQSTLEKLNDLERKTIGGC